MIIDKDVIMEGYGQLKVDIAVLKTKSDQTNSSLDAIVKQMVEVEQRVRKLERTTYLLLGGLIFLQLLPIIAGSIQVLAW